MIKGNVFLGEKLKNPFYFLTFFHPSGTNPAPRLSGKLAGEVNVPFVATPSSQECVPKGQLSPPSKSE